MRGVPSRHCGNLLPFRKGCGGESEGENTIGEGEIDDVGTLDKLAEPSTSLQKAASPIATEARGLGAKTWDAWTLTRWRRRLTMVKTMAKTIDDGEDD